MLDVLVCVAVYVIKPSDTLFYLNLNRTFMALDIFLALWFLFLLIFLLLSAAGYEKFDV